MIYTNYGKTGIQVSTIGFGGMRFKDPGNFDQSAALIVRAWENGINYFDTAPGYDRSEQIYGHAFRQMLPRRQERPFYVATKTMQATPDGVRRDLETSLTRMGLDYIDFYHMWCVLTLESFRKRREAGVLDEFEKLKTEGLVRHICVSTHMTGSQIGDMLAEYPFEGVLLGYSAMNFKYREKGLDAAAQKFAGVVVMNPLGGGLIPQNPARFDFLKARSDRPVVEAALHFLIDDKRISTALVGFAHNGELDQALQAVAHYRPLDAGQKKKIRDGITTAFNQLCTGCCYCDKCPQGIPVPKFMDAYNHYLLSGKSRQIVDRLKWHWGIHDATRVLKACTRCRICEQACTQKLPVLERFDHIRHIQKKVAIRIFFENKVRALLDRIPRTLRTRIKALCKKILLKQTLKT